MTSQQKRTKDEARRVVEGGEVDRRSQQQQGQNPRNGQQGDNRTPDEPIGEVAYANRDPAKKKTGEF
jgi:hypothetical protein